MMRLPSATSVSTRQTSRAERGEVVFKSFYAQVIACPWQAVGKCDINDNGRSFWPTGPS